MTSRRYSVSVGGRFSKHTVYAIEFAYVLFGFSCVVVSYYGS